MSHSESIKIVKNRLTFRSAAEYFRKPVKTVDFDSYLTNFQEEIALLNDSDNNYSECSEISNALIDQNELDKPQRILTLYDYKRKIKDKKNFKFIHEFTDCYKGLISDCLSSEEKVKVNRLYINGESIVINSRLITQKLKYWVKRIRILKKYKIFLKSLRKLHQK